MKKFKNFLNEDNSTYDLEFELEEYVDYIDTWMYNNEDKIIDTIEMIDDLDSIIYHYEQFKKKNEDKLKDFEVDVTLNNMSALKALNSIKSEDLNKIMDLLKKINNTDDE